MPERAAPQGTLGHGQYSRSSGNAEPTRRQFSKQFKAETVALIRSSGKSVPLVCRDLDLAESVVRRCLAQADIDDGRREGLTTAEREELTSCPVRIECCARSAISGKRQRHS